MTDRYNAFLEQLLHATPSPALPPTGTGVAPTTPGDPGMPSMPAMSAAMPGAAPAAAPAGAGFPPYDTSQVPGGSFAGGPSGNPGQAMLERLMQNMGGSALTPPAGPTTLPGGAMPGASTGAGSSGLPASQPPNLPGFPQAASNPGLTPSWAAQGGSPMSQGLTESERTLLRQSPAYARAIARFRSLGQLRARQGMA